MRCVNPLSGGSPAGSSAGNTSANSFSSLSTTFCSFLVPLVFLFSLLLPSLLRLLPRNVHRLRFVLLHPHRITLLHRITPPHLLLCDVLRFLRLFLPRLQCLPASSSVAVLTRHPHHHLPLPFEPRLGCLEPGQTQDGVVPVAGDERRANRAKRQRLNL